MRILHYTSGMEKPNDAQDNTPSEPKAGQTEGPREPTIGLEDPAAVDTPTGTEEVSLSDLINQAKRTHELVDAVDLKKVVAHDDEETPGGQFLTLRSDDNAVDGFDGQRQCPQFR